MERVLSATAQKLREAMLRGDVAIAAPLAEKISDVALAAFNAANTDVCTSMLSRAFLIRAQLEVAAHWLADLTKTPLPECFAAVRDLVDNPPAEVEGVCYIDPSIET